MTFNALTNRISLIVGALAVGLLAVGFSQHRPPDDGTEAFAKLRRIGAALQLYRAEHGIKPVEERHTFSDAGLPPHMLVLIQPGHRWTLPIEDLRLSYSKFGREGGGSDFTQLYWERRQEDELGAISRYFAQRGEKLPVLSDEEWQKVPVGGSKLKKCPVLRLDGSVEWVTYDHEDWPARLER